MQKLSWAEDGLNVFCLRCENWQALNIRKKSEQNQAFLGCDKNEQCTVHLFRRRGLLCEEGQDHDGRNSCGQKSNSWQLSSSAPPVSKLQITGGIPLAPAPASSSVKSADSPYNVVLTPECSHVSIDLLSNSWWQRVQRCEALCAPTFPIWSKSRPVSSWAFPPWGHTCQGCVQGSFKGNSTGKRWARKNKFIYCQWAWNT